jgi:hypothetical protein
VPVRATACEDFNMPFGPVISLSSLSGMNGFRIDGEAANDASGTSVASAGDVNGDGYDDLIIGALGADVGGNNESGAVYVVFGSASAMPANIKLSELNGQNGFRLEGVTVNDLTGNSVASAGDVNGDGYDDLIVGAYGATVDGNTQVGSTYVVFGKATGWAASVTLSTLDGTNGFRLNGVAPGDASGWSVASAGDINGDGLKDLVIGAYLSDPGGNGGAGSSYVVFGKAAGWSAEFSLSTLNGANGFRLDGASPLDGSGFSVATAGDVNGDGLEDLIIGAYATDQNGVLDSGSSYVVFGKTTGWAASLNLSELNGINGFRIVGVAAGDFSGFSVASAGDVNGDGFSDVIIGAVGADPGGRFSAGSTYILFGKAQGWAPILPLSILDGTNGFRIDGAVLGDSSGLSVSSAGDINADGLADLIIGASNANTTGSSYVVFGKETGWISTLDVSSLNGSTGFRLDGLTSSDSTGRSVSGAGDFNGDGFDDLIIGANGSDAGGLTDQGATYIIFGRESGQIIRTGTAGDDSLRGGSFNDSLSGRGYSARQWRRRYPRWGRR